MNNSGRCAAVFELFGQIQHSVPGQLYTNQYLVQQCRKSTEYRSGSSESFTYPQQYCTPIYGVDSRRAIKLRVILYFQLHLREKASSLHRSITGKKKKDVPKHKYDVLRTNYTKLKTPEQSCWAKASENLRRARGSYCWHRGSQYTAGIRELSQWVFV